MSMNTIRQPLSSDAIESTAWSRLDWLLLGILVACTFFLYMRTESFDFVFFDDQTYIYANTYVIQGLSLRSLHWALTATPNGNWHPLTTIVQLTLSSLFGVKPAAYHLLNVILHSLNVALLYLFLRRSTGLYWPAFFTALLWGWHPLRVESVAWVSELKDVLSGAFWLGCMLAYWRYTLNRCARRYSVMAVLFVLSLLSKPMAVTLPMLLLVLDFWPLSNRPAGAEPVSAVRWWTFRVTEKLPLLALSIADIFAQRNALVFGSDVIPLAARLKNAFISTGWYMRDLFFPHYLAILYLHPSLSGKAISNLAVFLCIGLFAGISALAVFRARRQPYLLVGWLWFIGTLVPVIGLVQVGEQARADRFTYIPSIGLMMAVVWSLWDLAGNRRTYQLFAFACATAAALALACVTWMDTTPWKNTETLFNNLYVLQPDNHLAVSWEGLHAFDEGRINEAVQFERRAVELAPYSFNTHGALAHIMWKIHRLGEAQEQFLAALKINPHVSNNWDELGQVYSDEAILCAKQHLPAENAFRSRAVLAYRKAMVEDPISVPPREHLAFELASLNQIDEAIQVWEDLLQLFPGDAHAHGDLADALRLKGDLPEAVQHYQAAIFYGAKNPAWETELAWLYAINGAITPAELQPMVAIAKDACDQTQYRSALALDAYAASLARVGQFDAAVTAAQQGVAAANAVGLPKLAAVIQMRLGLYQRGLAYVVGDPATRPATAPTPSTNP